MLQIQCQIETQGPLLVSLPDFLNAKGNEVSRGIIQNYGDCYRAGITGNHLKGTLRKIEGKLFLDPIRFRGKFDNPFDIAMTMSGGLAIEKKEASTKKGRVMTLKQNHTNPVVKRHGYMVNEYAQKGAIHVSHAFVDKFISGGKAATIPLDVFSSTSPLTETQRLDYLARGGIGMEVVTRSHDIIEQDQSLLSSKGQQAYASFVTEINQEGRGNKRDDMEQARRDMKKIQDDDQQAFERAKANYQRLKKEYEDTALTGRPITHFAINKGCILNFDLTFYAPQPHDLGLTLLVLQKWSQYPFLGGLNTRGFGRVNLNFEVHEDGSKLGQGSFANNSYQDDPVLADARRAALEFIQNITLDDFKMFE